MAALFCSPWSSNQALTGGLCVPLRDHTVFTCCVCTLIASSVSVSVQEEVCVCYLIVCMCARIAACSSLIAQSLLTSRLISTWPLVFIYRPHGVLCPDWLWHCRSTANWINTITVLTFLPCWGFFLMKTHKYRHAVKHFCTTIHMHTNASVIFDLNLILMLLVILLDKVLYMGCRRL